MQGLFHWVYIFHPFEIKQWFTKLSVRKPLKYPLKLVTAHCSDASRAILIMSCQRWAGISQRKNRKLCHTGAAY